MKKMREDLIQETLATINSRLVCLLVCYINIDTRIETLQLQTIGC